MIGFSWILRRRACVCTLITLLLAVYSVRGAVCCTMLKAHLANIRSTSGLPKLDPLSLCVGGIGKRRGE